MKCRFHENTEFLAILVTNLWLIPTSFASTLFLFQDVTNLVFILIRLRMSNGTGKNLKSATTARYTVRTTNVLETFEQETMISVEKFLGVRRKQKGMESQRRHWISLRRFVLPDWHVTKASLRRDKECYVRGTMEEIECNFAQSNLQSDY